MGEHAHFENKLALRINPALEITVVAVTEQQACVVVDDFLLNPDEVVAYASERMADFSMPERAYPGVVLPVANNMMAPLIRFIQTEMSRLFSFCRGGIEFHTQLSIITLQPRDFSWIQRLCHTDPKLADGRRNYAALLYLFHDPALGGPAFSAGRTRNSGLKCPPGSAMIPWPDWTSCSKVTPCSASQRVT